MVLGKVVGEYLREKGADRVFTKGYKVEVFYAVVSQGIPLFRTEGVGDINRAVFIVDGEQLEVPVILPEKIQAKLRRDLLATLRKLYQKNSEAVDKFINELKQAGYILREEKWNCYIAPPQGTTQETDIGLCGFCPSCMIFGTIVDRTRLNVASTAYGVKSRVVHDPAFALTKYKSAVAELTHNKVGEGVSYTGQSLYTERHVIPGVVFIGKIVLCDVTETEAEAIINTLAHVSRLGGRESIYGSVKTIILGVKGGYYESLSSYDVVKEILEKHKGKLENPETYINEIKKILKENGFKMVIDDKDIHEVFSGDLGDDFYIKLWEDTSNYALSIAAYVKKVEGKEKKKKGK